MRDDSAFDRAEFLGLARHSRRDPYRLSLFARHFDPDEDGLAVLPISGGTFVVTDRRLILFTSHLEVDGAWNVREFQGYTVNREIPLEEIASVTVTTHSRSNEVEDVLHVSTASGRESFLVSRGPERVLSDEDVARATALLTQRSPARGPPA